MIGTVAPMAQKQQHNKFLILIAVYKGLEALLFIALGIGAIRLLHRDIGDVFDNIREALHFSPESRLVNFLAAQVSLVNAPMLRRIGAFAFCYAGLSLG